MSELFEKAIPIVLKHEGGYVNDPNDLGGETKYGISKRSYPHLDIKNLTVEQAVEIYKRDWWDRYKYESIGDLDIAAKVFDLAVNMGANPAHRILQKAVNFVSSSNLKVDGVIGPLTLAALADADAAKVRRAMEFYAAEYYYSLAKARPANRNFLLGWLNRAYD